VRKKDIQYDPSYMFIVENLAIKFHTKNGRKYFFGFRVWKITSPLEQNSNEIFPNLQWKCRSMIDFLGPRDTATANADDQMHCNNYF